MNEIMWKGKSYSGMTVDNGIIINDGDEVVSGSEATSNIQKCGGYRQFLGSQGRRLICQGNLTLMGQIPEEERIDGYLWKKSIDDGTTWEDWYLSAIDGYGHLPFSENAFNEKIIFSNIYDNDNNIIGIENTQATSDSIDNTKYKYERHEIDLTNQEGYLINFIKPADLYSKIYIDCLGSPNVDYLDAIDFSQRHEHDPDGRYFYTKIVKADLDNYYVSINGYYRGGWLYVPLGTFKIPKSTNTFGIFLYCTDWSADGAKLGLGVAGFNVIHNNNFTLTAFYPIGRFRMFDSHEILNTLEEVHHACKYKWKVYYKIANNSNNKAYFNTNDGQFYTNYDEETSTFSNQIRDQNNGTVFLDLLTNNYYMCAYNAWYLLYVTSADDSYVYSPVNNVNGGWWTAISPSPEYEYAAQITQTYNYIDRATYNSLVPSDSDD